MARVFASFAVANIILLILTALLGALAAPGHVDRHVLMAVVALLVSALVQVLSFTYMTVSGKVLAQAIHLASLPNDSLKVLKGFKKAYARCLGLVMLSAVVAIATGASAWRGARLEYHWLAVLITFVVHVLALERQWRLVARNERLVGEALAEYGRKKAMGTVPREPSTGEGDPRGSVTAP